MYKFFYSQKSPYSNWYKSYFTVDGITYNCVEQYMMYQKAILFNDLETASKILTETDQGTIKRFGRQVKNFDEHVWDKYKYSIVKTGVKAKFEQNETILTNLLSHHGKIFVEASPRDRIYGIGFSEEDALQNIDKWGQNLLGNILTEVCNELK